MTTKSKTLGYVGIDQYGTHYHIDKHPRKELKEKHYLTGKVSKMYCDTKDGGYKETGYIVGNLWIDIYAIGEWKQTKYR